jgi:sensor domain CHASE-containing protein/HPt (histidine-containing phosphotransfer) domain-containing protein
MKLRYKSLLIVGTTLVCLLAIVYTVSRQVLLAGFLKVEREDTERNMRRVLDAFGETVNNLSVKAADWAKWDDTYKFMQDRNPQYIESNLTDATLSELKIDFILFYDQKGDLFCSQCRQQKNKIAKALHDTLLATIGRDSALVRHRSEQSVVSGRMNLQCGPMNIVSRPILTSQGKGPKRGTLIFGDRVEKDDVDRIAQITHLMLTIHPWDLPQPPSDVAAAKEKITSERPIFVTPHSEDTIAGYARISDLSGNPILLAHIDLPRDIYHQGTRTIRYLLYCIISAGVFFAVVLMALLQKIVVSRIGKLSADANAIAASGDHSARVNVDGKDELARLAASINGMLSALERVEAQLRGRNADMRLIMNTVPSGLVSMDESYRINPEYSKSAETIIGKKDLARMEFFEAIGLTGRRAGDRKRLSEFFDTLLLEPLPEQELMGLNPFEELSLESEKGRISWIRLRYYIARGGEGGKNHLLAVIEDITEEHALSERARQSELENVRLKAIAEDPDLFREFLAEMKELTERAREQSDRLQVAADRPYALREIYRVVHTIKGMAGVFELGAVVESASRLEQILAPIGHARDSVPVSDEVLRESLALLSLSLGDIVERTKRIFGEEFADVSGILLRIPLGNLRLAGNAIGAHIGREALDAATAASLRDKIEGELRGLRLIPARRGLAKAFRIVPGLLRRFEKDIDFHIEGAEALIDCEIARELNAPLIHLLRNAVDHGIEKPEERLLRGKTDRGRVRVVIREDGESLVIQVADDGMGLDPRLLRKIAVQKGLKSEAEISLLTDAQARQIIFMPGFSTSATVTEISGRGIGMDAALAAVRDRLKGTLTVESETGKGATFTIAVPIGDARGGMDENSHC